MENRFKESSLGVLAPHRRGEGILKGGRVTLTEKKFKSRAGFTMLELLIVVGIIAVLSGVAFMNVVSHQRSLNQIERDSVAKEIFVAAQNHLTVAQGEGYGGITYYGTEINQSSGKAESGSGIYELVYPSDSEASGDDSIWEAMLPYGSIDETVRTGGSYIITYQKETGLILDVFYTSRYGTPEIFNHTLLAEEYESLYEGYREESNKYARKSASGSDGTTFVLGWYGGTQAASLAIVELEAPSIELENGNRLTVTITDPNAGNAQLTDKYTLNLVVTGKESGAQTVISIDVNDPRVSQDSNGNYVVVLDDVTEPGLHFGDLESDNGTPFHWGEDIEVQAIASSTEVLAKEGRSEKKTTNSLFGDVEDGTASVNNFRHFENLDKSVSQSKNTGTSDEAITQVTQTSDIDWDEFVDSMSQAKGGTTGSPVSVYVYDADGNTLNGTGGTESSTNTNTDDANMYRPIDMEGLDYDGGNHKISNVTVEAENAGLFGSVTGGSIGNLELVDFDITGTTNAGALAAETHGTQVENVVVYNSSQDTDKKITATGSAGGLIGLMEGGEVTGCSAAVIVGDSSTVPDHAGGLIGKATSYTDTDGKVSGPVITASYSGGHTENGSYEEHTDADGNVLYDVTGNHAGGLIGTAEDTTVAFSYSTCSVDGKDKGSGESALEGTGGGLIGSAEDTEVTYSYCTGLVSGDGDNAFLGEGEISGSDNYYYEMINMVVTEDSDGNVTDISYKGSGSTATDSSGNSVVSPFDADASTMNSFLPGTWDSAKAYDDGLVDSYQGMYNLPTVEQMVEARIQELEAKTEITTEEGAELTELKSLQATLAEYGVDTSSSGSTVSSAANTHYGDWPSSETVFYNAPSST